MKPLLPLLILFLLFRSECRADIKFVDFKKIDPAGKYRSKQQFLLDNLVYYDHWSPDWPYEIPKDSVIRELKNCLCLYSPLKANAYETDLLLGELAHYLYNLNLRDYYDTAEAWFQKAITIDNKDCRGYWFLAYHYTTSSEIIKGVEWFNKALNRVNKNTGRDFWQEYAFAMMNGGMPAHSRYAIDHYLRMGGTSLLSKIMDSTLRSKAIQADPDITYTAKALWQPEKNGARVVFLSRPLGLKFETDSNWRLQLNPYGKHVSVVSMRPPIVQSAKGTNIGYTIAIVMHTAGKDEKLEDFVKSMIKTGGTKDAVFPFAGRFSSGISYTVKDPSIYADRGGAHMHFIGIERDMPDYPGMTLEDQAEQFQSTPGRLEYYTLSLVHTRFPGRIFYLFLLDTCEDIHEESWKSFKNLLDNMKLD